MTEPERPWELDFYTGADGQKPVKSFLSALEKSRPQEFRKILSKFKLFEKMGLRAAMEVKLVAPLRGYNGLYELRVKGTGFRFYGFTWEPPDGAPRLLLLASAEEKDDTEADDAVIRRAAEARTDWYRRHSPGRE